MSSVNKAIVLGRVGKDPESRFFSDGAAVCNVSVATSETWKDKETGERKESTEWHNITFRAKLAEIAGQYLKKGSLVYIEGRIKTRKWQDKNGQDRYTTEIVANEMKMIGPKPEGHPAAQQAPALQQAGGFGGMDDDIPFMRHAHGAVWRAI